MPIAAATPAPARFPLTLDEAMQEGRVQSGNRVIASVPGSRRARRFCASSPAAWEMFARKTTTLDPFFCAPCSILLSTIGRLLQDKYRPTNMALHFLAFLFIGHSIQTTTFRAGNI